MISKSYELWVALRFLWKGKWQTVLIVMGIAVGVAVQFFLMSLIGGLQDSLIDKTIGTSPHLTVVPKDTIPVPLTTETEPSDFRQPVPRETRQLLSWQEDLRAIQGIPGVLVAAPVTTGNGFLEAGGNLAAVQIKGLGLPGGPEIYKLNRKTIAGGLRLEGGNALIGASLSKKFGLHPDDQFTLRNDRGGRSFFRVEGVFDLGSNAVNQLVIIPLDRARDFLSIKGVSAIEAQIINVFQADALKEKYQSKFLRSDLESWQEKNRELLSALSSQSGSSNIIQFFIIFSIGLGIGSVLGIAVVQKSRQLGILKAMGTTNRSAALIFMYQGLVMGLLGAGVGILLGFGLATMFVNATKNSGTGFGLRLGWVTLVIPLVLAIVSATVAALIPARKAMRLNPMEVIRNG